MRSEAICTSVRCKAKCCGPPERVSAYSWNATYNSENVVSEGRFTHFERATDTERSNRDFFRTHCDGAMFYEVEMHPHMISVPVGMLAIAAFPALTQKY